MPELPQKKIGIIACSGEELPEGTVTRLAALRVLEQLRPDETVTICLPLFLAGGEGDRAFARFYPTIAIDGCQKRCAFRGTEQYSNRPAVGIVITDLVEELGLEQPQGRRTLDAAGMQLVEYTAERVAENVDSFLHRPWSRREGSFNVDDAPAAAATCTCGSGIPVQIVVAAGQEITLAALPLIFETFGQGQKLPTQETIHEIMETVKIYNTINPEIETTVEAALLDEYTRFWNHQER